MSMEQPGPSREVAHGHDLRSSEAVHHTEGCVPEHETATPAAPPTPHVKPVQVPIRSSARVSKKVKLDLPVTPVPAKISKKDEEPADNKQPQVGTPDGKRPKRNWGLWSLEDKNTFFEALNEYGKDFDAMQTYFTLKMKKRGATETKNKDQVRHFYYRNWHKISKFIEFSSDLQKVTTQLYALINFGELRKRMGRAKLDKNTIMKLHELIYNGFTLIKVRGKTVRVKTPLCRALRRLNMIDKDNPDLPKLPPRVTVELRPINNETWGIVHATAQNPRARTSLPLQHRLSTLICYLQNRWRQRDHKLLEKLVSGGEVTPVETRQEMKLRLAPRAGSRISLTSVNLNENLTSTSLSLLTYEERFLGNSSAEHAAGHSVKGRNNCAKNARSKKKMIECESKKQANKEAPPSVHHEPMENEGQSLDQIHAKTVEEILSLQLEGDDATDGDLRSSPLPVETEEVPAQVEPEPKKPKTEDQTDYVARIKAGWTMDNANTLTLGELYIMFGADGKLLFDYSWERVPVVIKTPAPTQVSVTVGAPSIMSATQASATAPTMPLAPTTTPIILSAAQPPTTATIVPTAAATASTSAVSINTDALSPSKNSETVVNLLHKLVSLVKMLPLIKDKATCACGHVCGKNSRGQSTGRQRATKASKASAAAAAKATVQLDTLDGVTRGTLLQTATVVVPNTLELPPGTTMAFQPSSVSTASYQVASLKQPLQDGVFRRPLLAPSQFKPQSATSAEEAFKAQLDQFRPKYCNRRGRSGRKNVVVQRMLPLLPKTANGQSMLTLKVMPQTGEFRPISSQTTNARVLSFTSVPMVNSGPSLVLPVMQQSLPATQPGPSGKRQKPLQPATSNQRLIQAQPVNETPAAPPSVVIPKTEVNNVTVTPPQVAPPSPPSITALLGLGAEELSLGADSTTLLDPPNFVGLLSNDDRAIDDCVPDPCSLLHSGGNTPPISPTRILKESDNQWLNSEVVDFSLSSFLGHLDSPMKNSSSSNVVMPTNDDTRMSQDVEAQLQCLMSESSVDYMAKFADLAAQIASDTSAKK